MFLTTDDDSTTELLTAKGVQRTKPVIFSASDLTRAAACQFGVMTRMDRMLDPSLPRPDKPSDDKMLKRAAGLGTAHEARFLSALRSQFGAGVVDVPEVADKSDILQIEQASIVTTKALEAGADVVYQATFFDGRFHGYADFIIRDQATGSYSVWDTKLARREKSTALLQIAAYADQLQRLNIPVAATLHLALGSHENPGRATADLVPLYRDHRRRFEAMIDTHQDDHVPVQWRDERYRACCTCDACTPYVQEHRDLTLVALLSQAQRGKLLESGISTVEQLATSEDDSRPRDMGERTFATRRAQAALQAQQHLLGYDADDEPLQVLHEVFSNDGLTSIPRPSAGDMFFDFEGDPLWTATEGAKDWGLEYLFGWIETGSDGQPTEFRHLWADDRQGEESAFTAFMDRLALVRDANPRMHVYHYAPYEQTALSRLAGAYGRASELAEHYQAGVFVDLYKIVRASLRVGQESYSIKKLEPLYTKPREGLDNAADSIDEYVQYCAAVESNDHAGASTLKSRILSYNEDDCESTRLLRDWLIVQKESDEWPPDQPASNDTQNQAVPAPAHVDFSPLIASWIATLDDEIAANQTHAAIGALGGAGGYYRREEAVAAAQRIVRLDSPIGDWSDEPNVFYVDSTVVPGEWEMATIGARNPHYAWTRKSLVVGHWGAGTSGSHNQFGAIYAADTMTADEQAALRASEQLRGACASTYGTLVIESGQDERYLIEESLGVERWPAPPTHSMPVAVDAWTSIRTTAKDAAILERQLEAAALIDSTSPTEPSLPRDAVFELLGRRAPRTFSGRGLVGVDETTTAIQALVSTIVDLDQSYVAVQGPPGTGKTYTAAHVVRELVLDHGFKVGICGQSHKVVENFLKYLTASDKADLPKERVFKEPQNNVPRNPSCAWTDGGGFKTFKKNLDGYVVAGTSFYFANSKKIERDSLDLLVIDEAGQFGLADLIANSVSAKNILLLGDPQQLPMVVQGSHPGSIDTSALGWLCGDEPVLPPEFGYFLDTTWRMHPDLCSKISTLSYAGGLRSHEPVTTTRGIESAEPGVHVHVTDHENDVTSSEAEAAEVLSIVEGLLGKVWWDDSDGASIRRPITESDVIVVAPYNAQVNLIHRRLAAAGHADVLVGTVDKMQGQDFPVAIISMTASDVSEAPRGAGFVLSRNRTNVAASRAKFATHIVRSRTITEYLPSNPSVLADLGAFIGLCE
jgi:predicted RecB family nuclease